MKTQLLFATIVIFLCGVALTRQDPFDRTAFVFMALGVATLGVIVVSIRETRR